MLSRSHQALSTQSLVNLIYRIFLIMLKDFLKVLDLKEIRYSFLIIWMKEHISFGLQLSSMVNQLNELLHWEWFMLGFNKESFNKLKQKRLKLKKSLRSHPDWNPSLTSIQQSFKDQLSNTLKINSPKFNFQPVVV